MTENEKEKERTKIRWTFYKHSQADELSFTPEFVERLAAENVKSRRISEDEQELENNLLELKNNGKPGDYFVAEIDLTTAEKESHVWSRIATLRSKIGVIIKKQDWEFKAGDNGKQNNRRAYDTIPYLSDGRAFLIVRKLQSIDVNQKQ